MDVRKGLLFVALSAFIEPEMDPVVFIDVGTAIEREYRSNAPYGGAQNSWPRLALLNRHVFKNHSRSPPGVLGREVPPVISARFSAVSTATTNSHKRQCGRSQWKYERLRNGNSCPDARGCTLEV